MILNELTMKNIYDHSINEQIYIKCDMSLLENKFKYWNRINNDPNYMFIMLLKEYQENVNNYDNNYKDKIINAINENIIYKISDELKESIEKRKINIDEYLREGVCNSINNIKCYNRILDNIKKLNKKFDFDNLMKKNKFLKENEELSDINTFSKIVENVIKSYKDTDKRELYHITIESVVMYNTIHRLYNDTNFIVYEITKEFVNNDTFSNENEILESINNISSIIECNNNISEYFDDSEYIIRENKLKTKKIKTIRELIQGYELKPNKNTPQSIKNFMNKIYAKPLDNIVNDTPHILGFFRRAIIMIGPYLVNPVLGILAGMVDYMLSNNINRINANRYLNDLKKEKEKCKKKRDKLKSEKAIKNIDEYIKTLDNSIDKVESYINNLKSDKEDNYNNEELEEINIIKSMSATMAIIESSSYFDTEDYSSITDILTEGKFLSNIKLAGEALKSKIKNLKGKEKNLCIQLDNTMDKFVNDIESALTTKKREDIIKGKILPSYSRMIKMLLAGGALYAVNPIIAATAALGTMAVSKKASMREKQFILDEIDINLKIIEKKINQADIKGDDKALEDLYKTQMKLQRERQRIKYNMKVYSK